MNIAESETSRMFLVMQETSDVLHVASRVPILPSRQMMAQLRATKQAELPAAVEALWVAERAVSSSRATSPEKRRLKTPGSVASSFSKDFFLPPTSHLADLRKIWHAPDAVHTLQDCTPLNAHSNTGLLAFAGYFDDLLSLFQARSAKSNTEIQSLQDYVQRKEQFIEKTEQQIQLASAELARQREVRQSEALLAQETIDKLTQDIEQLEKGYEEEITSLATNLEATTQQDKALNLERLTRTAQTVTTEQANLDKSATENRDAELDGRKKKARLELELKSAIELYDTKVSAASRRVEHAKGTLKDVQNRIQKLQAYFKQKEADNAAADVEEAQDRREKHAQAVLDQLRISTAAHRIMRYYRLKVLAPRAAEEQLKKMKKKKK